MLVAAGFFLYRRREEGLEFLLLYSSRHSEWGFPKGHLEKDETLKEGARRELKEETGLEEIDWKTFKISISYPVQGELKEVIYYLAELENSRGEVRLSPEHSRWGWFSPQEVKEKIPHANLLEAFARAWSFLEKNREEI